MCDSTMVLHPQRSECATVQWFCILKGQNVEQCNGLASSKAKMCGSALVLHAHRPNCATVQRLCIGKGQKVCLYDGFTSSQAKMCDNTMVFHPQRPKMYDCTMVLDPPRQKWDPCAIQRAEGPTHLFTQKRPASNDMIDNKDSHTPHICRPRAPQMCIAVCLNAGTFCFGCCRSRVPLSSNRTHASPQRTE
jgi:hypothetical protein